MTSKPQKMPTLPHQPPPTLTPKARPTWWMSPPSRNAPHRRGQRPHRNAALKPLALIEAGHRQEGRRAGHRLHRRHPGRQEDQRSHSPVPPLALTCVALDFAPPAPSPLAPPALSLHRHGGNIAGPTGVEMEALTAVQVALLTIYDMAKAADRGMSIRRRARAAKSIGASRGVMWRTDARCFARRRLLP